MIIRKCLNEVYIFLIFWGKNCFFDKYRLLVDWVFTEEEKLDIFGLFIKLDFYVFFRVNYFLYFFNFLLGIVFLLGNKIFNMVCMSIFIEFVFLR